MQSVHTLSAQALRRMLLDRYTDAIAFMPGVVATGEELHVRGGRSGKMVVALSGVPLGDPQFGGAPELPLFGVRAAELMTGPLDADRPGTLAGELDIQTEVPTASPRLRARWLSDGRRFGGDDERIRISFRSPASVALPAARQRLSPPLDPPDHRRRRRVARPRPE